MCPRYKIISTYEHVPDVVEYLNLVIQAGGTSQIHMDHQAKSREYVQLETESYV